MNWKEILPSEDLTHFTYKGAKFFDLNFIEVMKFHEPGLAPVRDEFGWFHINADGKPLYNQRYIKAFGYYFLRAAVEDATGCFHIDERGLPIYDQRYAWCGNYQENICPVKTNEGFYIHIDSVGNQISAQPHLYAGDYKDGIACIRTENGWTHIRKDQSLLHAKHFKGLGIYHKGFATALDGAGWFHIDMFGNELYTKRYKLVEPFYNGVALVLSENGFETIRQADRLK